MPPSPDHAEAALSRGLAHLRRGKYAEAVAALKTATALRRGFWEAHANLGLAFKMLARFEEAIAEYRLALKSAPESAALLGSLASAYHAAGRATEAAKIYERALRLDDGIAGLHLAYAALLAEGGALAKAAKRLERAAELEPANAAIQTLLGQTFAELGERDRALVSLKRAASGPAPSAESLWRLAAALAEARQPDEAEPVARQLAARFPDQRGSWATLGKILSALGRTAEARASFREEWQRHRDPVSLVLEALCLPLIPRDLGEIERSRQAVREGLAAAGKAGLRLDLAGIEGMPTGFLLSYHGRDNRGLQTGIARFYRAACPALSFTAAHIGQPRPLERRLRVGFVSQFFHDHTIAKLFGGLIETLPRARFEIVLFLKPREEDPLRRRLMAAADRVVMMRNAIAEARRQIAAEQLDILYYPDIGMSAFTYFLAFARLAPVQCVGWGHPETTGIETIDYFVSAAAMEPEAGDRYYTERLIRLAGATVSVPRPRIAGRPLPREEFGLPADAHLYLCPQTLFKLHPDFDSMLADILRRDPAGTLVLVSDIAPSVNDLQRARLHAAGIDPARLVFVPRQDSRGFLSLLAAADVMLDPIHYSGGHTSLEAFSLGTPIVTLPGQFMRGCHTHGFYRLMGLTEGVAESAGDYVERAVRLGTDKERRAALSAKILAACPVLYDDRSAAEEHAKLFEAAIRSGSPPP